MTATSSTRTIGDLVSLRPVKTIIQLGDDADNEEVIDSFVLTEDLRLILEDFSQKLPQAVGSGIFLKGHYGTGKSHLLSFIKEDSPKGFPSLRAQLSTAPLPSFKVLSVSLIHHASDCQLEDIVLSSSSGAESAVQGRDDRLPRHLGVLEESIAEGHRGLIILFDELSEFLKSKPNPESLTEDLRYLQFLGELCQRHPIWVVGAIQEDLEGMGAATRETSLKLKDRFPLRWNLSQLHLEQILKKRLLIFKEGAEDFLARLHQRCQSIWPGAFARDGLLLNIYPLHPLTLDLLIHLGTLFSEHRGAIRFVNDILIGFDNRTSHLTREAHALIGPEHLYDYFSNRFEENLELQQYHRKAWVHLNERVQNRLPTEDHDLALRALKIILLCSIDPRQEGIDIVGLGEAMMLQIDSDAKKGQEELKINILEPILERCNYLKLTDGIYHIDLSHEGSSILDELITKRIANLPPLESGGWLRLLSLLDQNPLRLAPLLRQATPNVEVTWLNSTRTMKLRFGLEDGDCDLRILLPGQVSSESPSSCLAWEPLPPDDPELWKESLALMEIVESPADTAMEARAKEQALKRYRLERQRWREDIENLYLDGRHVLGNTPVNLQLDMARRLSFETFLEPMAHELFSRRHPLFRSIAPKIPYYSEQSYVQLIEHLFRPGSIKEKEASRLHLSDALHGIAIPMGLAEKKGAHFSALWDPERSNLVRDFLEEHNNTSDLGQLKASLRKGPWGLPSGQFNFLIWSGIAMGNLIAYRDEEELPFEKLSLYNLETIDSIEPRRALPDEVLHQLSRHPFFDQQSLSYSGLSLQRKLWESATRNIEQTRNFIGEKEDSVCHFWKYHSTSLKHHHTTCSNLLSQLTENKFDSFLGLSWLNDQLENLENWIHSSDWLKHFRELNDKKGKDLDRLIIFVLDEALEELPKEGPFSELTHRRRALLEEWAGTDEKGLPLEQVKSWAADVEQWSEDYRQAYGQSHQEANTRISTSLRNWISILESHGLTMNSPKPLCERSLSRELQFKAECRCGHRLSSASGENDQTWAEKLVELLEPLYGKHDSFSKLKTFCLRLEFDEARDLWQTIFDDLPKREGSPPQEISLDRLIGQGQVVNKKTIIEALEKHLPDHPEQFYRIKD